jgi:hypothetical protein
VPDPEDDTAQQPTERLEVGRSRPSLLEKLPARWRPHAWALLAFVLGIAVGAGAMLWRQDRPETRPSRVDEHDVELMLFDAVAPPTGPTGWASGGPLRVKGALLLSGAVTSTVSRIDPPDPGLDVLAPALPVTVSPADRFQPVSLKIIVRDCTAASRWTPGDRPFTIIWRDEYGKEHLDRGGDFGRSMANALVRYIEAVCDNSARRDRLTDRGRGR